MSTPIALSSPPAQTNAGSDTVLTFKSEVTGGIIQNNTSANVYLGLESKATLGSLALPPGYVYEFELETPNIHIYTAAAQNINGASAGNVVVLGRG